MSLSLVLAAWLSLAPAGCSVAEAERLVLDEHDYVFPRLSPDGTRLVVARPFVREEGAETTDIVLVDVATGAVRQLISRDQAEANEVYETYVVGVRWLDDRNVEVSLSDGDVGRIDLVVDAATGAILRTVDHEMTDAVVPLDFVTVARDARFYARHFTREELELSLLSSARRLDANRVVVQRRPRDAAPRPLFLIEEASRWIVRLGELPAEFELVDAKTTAEGIRLLLLSDHVVSVWSSDGKSLTRVVSWSPMRSADGDCPRLEAWKGRTYVFLRPCKRNEPAEATLWELAAGVAVRRHLDRHLDEFTASADGSWLAIGTWRKGRRIVRILDGCVLR